MNSTVCLMAFGRVQETTEATEFKKYIGIAGCKVVAFNPNKDELSKLYGREITKFFLRRIKSYYFTACNTNILLKFSSFCRLLNFTKTHQTNCCIHFFYFI